MRLLFKPLWIVVELVVWLALALFTPVLVMLLLLLLVMLVTVEA